ncbi:MAG: hypothetical protein ABIH20_00425 [Candidatus Diapherotrites archaeon]
MQIPEIERKYLAVVAVVIAFFVIFSQVPENTDFEETYYITYSSLTARKLVSSSNGVYEETVSLATNNNRFVLFTVFPDSLSEHFSEKEATGVVKELEKNSVFETRQKTGNSEVSVKFVFNERPENSSGINVVLAESFVDELSESQLREFNEKLFELKELKLSPVKANKFENEIAKKIVSAYSVDLKGKENQDLILFAGAGVPLEFFYSILSAIEPSEEFTGPAVTETPEQVPSYVSVKDEWLPSTRAEKRTAFEQKPIQVEVEDYFNPKASTSFMAVNPNDLSSTDLEDNGRHWMPSFQENNGYGSGRWIEGVPLENYSVKQTPTYEFNPSFKSVTYPQADVLDRLAELNSEGRLKGNFEKNLTNSELDVFNSMVEQGVIRENEPYKIEVDFDFTSYLEQHERIPESFEGTLSTTYTPLLGGTANYPVEVNVKQIDADVLLVTHGGQLEKDPGYEAALQSYSKALEAKGLKVAYYEIDDPKIAKLFVDNDFSEFVGDEPNTESTETRVLKAGENVEFGDGLKISVNEDLSYSFPSTRNLDISPEVDEEAGTVTFDVTKFKIPQNEFRLNRVAKTKEVIDTLRVHTGPDYLVVLGGDEIIPMPSVHLWGVETSDYVGTEVYTDELYGASELEFDDPEGIKISAEDEGLEKLFSDIVVSRMPAPAESNSTELITRQLEVAAELHNAETRVTDDVAIYYDDDQPTKASTRFFDKVFRRDRNEAVLEEEAELMNDYLTTDHGYYNVSDNYSYYFPKDNPDNIVGAEDNSFYETLPGHDLVMYYLHGTGDEIKAYGPPDKKENITMLGEDGKEKTEKVNATYVLTSSENLSQQDIDLGGQMVLCTACYGGSPFEKENPLYEEFLRKGAGSFVGNTDLGRGIEGSENDIGGILFDVVGELREGSTIGAAVQQTKSQKLTALQKNGSINPLELHQLFNTQLYGDPLHSLNFDPSYDSFPEGMMPKSSGESSAGDGAESTGNEGTPSEGEGSGEGTSVPPLVPAPAAGAGDAGN